MAHRTLVIGLAGRGNTWAQSVAAHAEFELTGIADIKDEVLAERGAALGLPPERRHADYQEALAGGNYEVAVVVLPNHLHHPATRDILEAGKHCLLEKPFTLELAHAEELVELAARKERVLVIGQNYRFEGFCRFVADFVREESLGKLAGVEGSFHMHRPPRFEHERKMPYPVLFIQGVHHLDWLLSFLPAPVTQVISRHRRVPWSEWDNPSACHLILECEDGVLVSYRASYESQGRFSGYCGLWRLEFEKGDLLVESDRSVWQVTERGQRRERLFAMSPGEKPGNAWLLDSLHAGITTGAEPPTSGRNNLQTLKLLFEVMGA